MSENDVQKTPQEAEAQQGGETPGQSAPVESSAQEGTSVRVVKRGGFAAWLALLLALGALAMASRPYWEPLVGLASNDAQPELEARIDGLSARVDEVSSNAESIDALRRGTDRLRTDFEGLRSDFEGLRGDFEALRDEIDAVESGQSDPSADIERLERRISELSSRIEASEGSRQDQVSGLRARLERIENQVGERLERFGMQLERFDGELEGADAERGTRLALVEIDSLLAFAQNRLAFGADVDLAERAWREAVTMIESLPPGRFGELADVARRELDRIEEYRPADAGTQVRRLFEMAEAAKNAWPRRGSDPLASDQPGEAAGSGWRARLSSAVDQLVQVESLDGAGPSRIDIDRAAAGIELTLRTAALSLAGSERGLAETLVAEAVREIPQAFDDQDPAVRSALQWLQAFEVPSDSPPPRLSETRERIADLVGESS